MTIHLFNQKLKSHLILILSILFVLSQPAISNPVVVNAQLPTSIINKLNKAKIDTKDISVVVLDLKNQRRQPIINWQSEQPRSPASVMKLVTTYAGLNLLGPNYIWKTPIYINGTVKDAVLTGDLIIQGKGDPFLVIENLWKALNKIQNMGIRHINGNIVLDQTGFALAKVDPNDFDGEGSRPYNVRPEALLLNFKAVTINFTPLFSASSKTTNKSARISYDVPLSGVYKQNKIPLDFNAPCGDWQQKIKATLDQPNTITFSGNYPVKCGNKSWSLAYPKPEQYASRVIAGLWKQLGGTISGEVVLGSTPKNLKPLLYTDTLPLAQVIYDINKYSNNVMAQQLFLSLALNSSPNTPASYRTASNVVIDWWQKKFPNSTIPNLENGSGLSRTETITAQALANMLVDAYDSPYMPELMSSLPMLGVDGTLRNKKINVSGHLKTGTLRNVSALAGYVNSLNGHRHVLVAIVNSPNSHNSQMVFDELLKWTAQQK